MVTGQLLVPTENMAMFYLSKQFSHSCKRQVLEIWSFICWEETELQQGQDLQSPWNILGTNIGDTNVVLGVLG